MTFYRILLFCVLIAFTSCQGPAKKSYKEPTITQISSPRVVKNFQSVTFAPDYDSTLVSQYIRSIFQDSKGNLWFGTIGEGVVKYDVNSLTYYSHPEGFHSKSVFAINEDKKGNLWFGTDQGVYKFDGEEFKSYAQKEGLEDIQISRKSILVDPSGKIWVGTHGGVYQYDPIADKKGLPCFSLFPLLPPINVADMMQDNSGNIWIASSDKGVFRYDGKEIVPFQVKEGLGENYAGGITQDKEGNLWFTMKNGICKFDGKTFTDYTPEDGLGGTEFWGILIEESGIIWITARGSTTRFDPSLPLPNSQAFKVYTPEDGFTCCVQSMYQDRSGNIWWGTGQGLYRFNGTRFYPVKQKGPWQEFTD